MSADAELDRWRREWQSESGVDAELRRKVRRGSRFLRLMLLGEVLVTVVIGGGATLVAVRAPAADTVVLGAAVWTFIAAAWVFGVTNRRGSWSPASMDTASFVDLSIRRCRASLAAVRFGTVLFLSEIVFCLGWIYQRLARTEAMTPRRFAGSEAVIVSAVSTAVFLVAIVRYRRRKRAELAYLLELRRESDIEPVREVS